MSNQKFKPVPKRQITNISENTAKNYNVLEYYKNWAVSAVIANNKSLASELTSRYNRLSACNKFWVMAIYELSKTKVLIKTYLCRDKFCNNCKKVKQWVMQNRFVPYMEKYKESLYHLVLTVPDCKGEDIGKTIRHMSKCFKTLVTYLNSNKKIRGLDLLQYGFEGCIRSFEITYKENIYHPHFHVAIVFNNSCVADNKNIINKFSKVHGEEKRSFSEFENLIQRLWWLLINEQRLSYDNIFSDNIEHDRYSCVLVKFNPEDYTELFGYMTKSHSDDNGKMTEDNFKALYIALNRYRQIQGYGVFYGSSLAEEITELSEEEFHAIEEYIKFDEEPVFQTQSQRGIALDNEYTVIKQKYTKSKVSEK